MTPEARMRGDPRFKILDNGKPHCPLEIEQWLCLECERLLGFLSNLSAISGSFESHTQVGSNCIYKKLRC